MKKMIECGNNVQHEEIKRKIAETSLTQADVEKICKVYYLLSDVNRFKIVQALLEGELCVYHLCEVCESSVSAVSHQLRLLKDNGIVKAKKFGKNVEYSIADAHIRGLIEIGINHLSCSKGE